MADKLIRVCDLAHEDGEELLAETRRTFSLDGVDYVVDLCDEDEAAFNEAWRQWVEHARRVGRGRLVTAGRRVSSLPEADEAIPDMATVRAWALTEGLMTSRRGRVPQEVVNKYEAAHGWQRIA